MVGRPLRDLVVAPADANLGRELVGRLKRGEPWEGDFPMRRRDGTTVVAFSSVVPLHDADGALVGMVGVSSDVGRAREAAAALEFRLGFLAEASHALAGSLASGPLLRRLARLAVPRLADWCSIEMLREDGSVEPVAIVHADPARVRWARRLRRRWPARPDADDGLTHVLRTGRPELYQELPPDMLVQAAADEEHLEALTGAGFTSAMIVPLRARRRTLGAITFVSAESGRRFGEDDLALAEALAERAALAVDNARLHEQTRASRRRAETLSNALERVLAIAPSFHAAATPEQAQQGICAAAVDLFGCDTASLWTVAGDEVSLAAREPPAATELVTRANLAAMPDVAADVVAGRRPSFVRDILERYDVPLTDEYVRATHVRSSLRIPIAVGDAPVDAFVALSWQRVAEAPSAEVLAAATRFADQAALALEHARRRVAQARAEELNAAMDRLLEMTPSFHGEEAPEAVAAAICRAAAETFTVPEAALWRRTQNGAELLAAVGPADGPAPLPPPVTAGNRPSLQARADRPGAHLVVPLARSAETLAMAWPHGDEAAGPAVLALAQRFADHALLALESARVREARSEAARLHAQLESNLLPTLALSDPGVLLATRYRPGEHRMLLGGDFFDALELPDGSLAVLVGDVSGHGPEAAALGATLRAGWRALSLAGLAPEELLPVLDGMLVRERTTREMFATVACGVVAPGRDRLDLVLAGHHPPLVLAEGVVVPNAFVGPPLGVLDRPLWVVSSRPLPADWGVLLFTDGLIEGRATPGSPVRYGLERVARHLVELTAAHAPADVLLDAVLEDVHAANGGELADDVAMVLLAAAPERVQAGEVAVTPRWASERGEEQRDVVAEAVAVRDLDAL